MLGSISRALIIVDWLRTSCGTAGNLIYRDLALSIAGLGELYSWWSSGLDLGLCLIPNENWSNKGNAVSSSNRCSSP